MGVRVVANVDDAIDHINHYSTKHSDSIVTRDEANARGSFCAAWIRTAVLLECFDSLYRCAEFGFWSRDGHQHAEVALPARPFALADCSSKYEIVGTGQVR